MNSIKDTSVVNKRVVLMELGGSHAECLHAQIHYLFEGGYEIHMICDSVVWGQIEEKERIKQVQLYNVRRGFFRQISMIWKVHRYLRKYKIGKLLVNTIGVTTVRNIFLFHLPKSLECIGIAHDGEKLQRRSSITTVIAKKMKKFFVLNDYIKANIGQQKGIVVESFYPIFFPKFKEVSVHKPEGELWFVVPGVVETNRRDYLGLLEELKVHPLEPLVKILFLGKMDALKAPDVVEQLNQIGNSKNQIVVFSGFLSNEEFHTYVQHSDIILPLIGQTDGSVYGHTRISGSFNLAFGYKIPLLIGEAAASYSDFSDSSFFYKPSELVSSINSFVNRRTELQQKRQQMVDNPRWSEEFQKQKYLSFIEAK